MRYTRAEVLALNTARAAAASEAMHEMPLTIARIFVRRYRDNGQCTAYVEWKDGSRTGSVLLTFDIGRGRVARTFGTHMHALFARGRAQGLRLERETW